MIKFRNPGSSIDTQIQIMKVLNEFYEDKIFGLNEIASALANNNLMTAYGYAGNNALSLSNVEDTSRNSTMMNAKMYAEIFRVLGWISSYEDDSSYPLVITELGKYVATSPSPLEIYKECLIGISSPQEMMEGVRYNEQVRFFACALKFIEDVGGTIYKHDLCMGPMSVDDVSAKEYEAIVTRIVNLRGSYARYDAAWKAFCANEGMKPKSVDNQTRFPVGALQGVGWVESVNTKTLYPPKNLKCLTLTEEGKIKSSDIKNLLDIRLAEFNKQDAETQDALIRLGFYGMLQRSGYDTSPIQDKLEHDSSLIERKLGSSQILFSPYQVLKNSRVAKALGIDTNSYESVNSITVESAQASHQNLSVILNLKEGSYDVDSSKDGLMREVGKEIKELNAEGMKKEAIVKHLFEKESESNQGRFYPLVGALFRLLGYECRVSRQGDNGARWDAIITGPGDAMPIEIKSPGEEEYISIKAIKQAAENKVILLSRETYGTSYETASLVVGYNAPNDRAEVSSLINAFSNVYGINVGVISFNVLLDMVVNAVLDGKTVDMDDIRNMKGIASAQAF